MPLALDRWVLAEEEAKLLPNMPSYWQRQVYRGRMYMGSSRASCPSNARTDVACSLPLRVDVLSQHEARLHVPSHATCDGSLEEALDAAAASETRHGECHWPRAAAPFWHPWLGAARVSLALIDLSTPSAQASVSRTGSLHRYGMVDSS